MSTAFAGQNWGMHVSVETITIIVSVVGLIVTLIASFGRLNRRIDDVHTKLDAKIDDAHTKLDAKIDHVHDKLDAKIDLKIDGVRAELAEMKGELTEVKIAIARLEGPRPQLALPR